MPTPAAHHRPAIRHVSSHYAPSGSPSQTTARFPDEPASAWIQPASPNIVQARAPNVNNPSVNCHPGISRLQAHAASAGRLQRHAV
ncbi:hypothetical protein EVG20_g10982 [Dentipellis fragilis]|uniref:Uncharacterized protein n=1 Tax=Dentipellis fragilis TaxID=205917 RepID=A0A4Y9XMG4_9AGAM|nr:hypothetical protein EVG20_g10982 [Dentipellis fragilis]